MAQLAHSVVHLEPHVISKGSVHCELPHFGVLQPWFAFALAALGLDNLAVSHWFDLLGFCNLFIICYFPGEL